MASPSASHLTTRRGWLLALGGLPLSAQPEARAAYLRRLLDELCTKIGPRPAGSPGDLAGAAVIERELARSVPRVERDPFPFRRWIAIGEPVFEIGGRRLETYLADHSPSTPPEGSRGVLRKRRDPPPAYELVQPETGRLLALAGISEFGRAIVTTHSPYSSDVPLFNIGRQDVAALDLAVRDRTPVLVRARAKWLPNAQTVNLAATLRGEISDEILIIAHADTKYNTPGAHDNTASLIVMLMLANTLAAGTPHRTITFLATAGEELEFIGARHYADTRRQRGTLANIKVCVNLDSLTYGPSLQINTTDQPLARLILAIHRELRIRSEPRVFDRDDTMDGAPFREAGARTVHLNSRGDDARTLPLWHRPEDRADMVKPEFAESSFLVLRELIARLAANRPI